MRRTRQWLVPIVATAGAGVIALLASMSVASSAGKGGSVVGKVTVTKNGSALRNHAGVVVYIADVGTRPTKTTAKVKQKNKQFRPKLTVVGKGSTVEFPNEDKIHHNVFSVSRAARFDLGLYKSGNSKSVKMRREGVVDVYCNIHPNMVAKIKVVDSDYYAVTKRDGTFKIDGVPPGTYPIIAWQAYGEQYRGTVTVTSGGTVRVNITLKQGKKNTRHKRKDGTPYGRYK